MSTDWSEVKRDAELRLAELVRHKEELQSKLDLLVGEESNLRTVTSMAEKMADANYWQSLMQLDHEAVLRSAHGESNLKKRLEAVGRPQELSGWSGMREEPVASKPSTSVHSYGSQPLPAALGVTRQPDESNTSYRIAAFMRDCDRAVDFEEVWQEFHNRGWIDPGWAKPQEALLQAMRRTEKYGWTQRLGSRRFRYDPSSHDERRWEEQQSRTGR